MKDWIRDIKEKTSNMNRKDTMKYILTYYWYHILIAMAAFVLIFIFIVHYSTIKKPEFTCVFVDEQVDVERDNLWTKEFAKIAGKEKDKIVIDSNYNFSFGDMQLEGVNESSYEKFFLKWRNNELDAVILSESFYQYCKEVGGEFQSLEAWDTKDYELYEDDNEQKAVVLGTDEFTEKITGKKDEKLLLAFPENGKNEKMSQLFMKYVMEKIRVD